MGDENKTNYTTAIIVAIIGALATISVAIVNNYNKKQGYEPSHSSAIVPTPPEPIVKKIILSNVESETAEYEIVQISGNDKNNYFITFNGYWRHYLLGCQNSMGEISEPGWVVGNIKILVTVESLLNGNILSKEYYDGSPIKVVEKNVRIVCSPKDVNSVQRREDGHIPAQDISSCSGRNNMTVTYTYSY